MGGTKNIIEQCLANPNFRKLVYVSSTGAIPELPKGQKIKEVDHFDPETTPELVRGCYSQSKALATQAVLDAVHKRGLNASIVHPSGIMGPEDFAVGETTKTVDNLCDVRGLAAGCIAAVDKGRKGECYILGNEEVSFKDFCKIICDEAGCKPIKMFLPCGIASFMAKQAEKKAKKTGKRPLLTTFSVYNLARNNDFDSSKAQRELGYHTRTYRETMRDEIAWLKETGKIQSMAKTG